MGYQFHYHKNFEDPDRKKEIKTFSVAHAQIMLDAKKFVVNVQNI